MFNFCIHVQPVCHAAGYRFHMLGCAEYRCFRIADLWLFGTTIWSANIHDNDSLCLLKISGEFMWRWVLKKSENLLNAWVFVSFAFYVCWDNRNHLDAFTKCVLDVDGSDNHVIIRNSLWTEETWQGISLNEFSHSVILYGKMVAQCCEKLVECTGILFLEPNIESNGLWFVSWIKCYTYSVLLNLFYSKN